MTVAGEQLEGRGVDLYFPPFLACVVDAYTVSRVGRCHALGVRRFGVVR